MAEARRRDEWDRTASQLWQYAEANRDKKKRSRPFTFKDFYPFKIDIPKPQRLIVPITALKALLPEHAKHQSDTSRPRRRPNRDGQQPADPRPSGG